MKQRAPPELKKTHPLGKAPQLETGDGRVLVESLVIARYLIETYDKEGKFKGDGGKNDWIRDEELCNCAAASIGPVMIMEVLMTAAAQATPFFVRPLVSVVHSALRKGFSLAELDMFFGYLDKQLGEQDYFMGSSPARPDFIISFPVDACIALGVLDIKKFPKLDQWYARCHARPAWKRGLEKGNGYDMRVKL